MKKVILSLFLAIMVTMGLYAQQISVVSSGGDTSLYRTLQEAIEGAESGSVIYLPGGGFIISDETKIDKKFTIIGVSHRGDTQNVDGATVIDGNLHFIGGSSGSAIMGVYISGNINVGTAENAVEDFTVKYCNANSIQVYNSASSGMVVNQCYLRNNSNFGQCNVKLENNILHSVQYITVGSINHNVLTNSYNWYVQFGGTYYAVFKDVNNTSITNNFILDNSGFFHTGGGCYVSNNCRGTVSWGDNPILLDEGRTWDDIFVANKGVTITSDYSLKESVDRSKFKGTDGTLIGIEGGYGFNPNALAPVPYIIAKNIPDHTDASGKLNIKIRVKAGQ